MSFPASTLVLKKVLRNWQNLLNGGIGYKETQLLDLQNINTINILLQGRFTYFTLLEWDFAYFFGYTSLEKNEKSIWLLNTKFI